MTDWGFVRLQSDYARWLRHQTRRLQAKGTCPTCGFWNDPGADVREADDGRHYCNQCGEMWTDADA